MKKLLSLLSAITISGTAMPTVIAASPYQEQEAKLENSEINYQQIDNSENLLRNKRGSNLIDSFSQVVITTHGSVTSSGVALNNKVYFGSYDGKVYEYDPETGSQKIVITAGNMIESSGVVLNNKVYFGSYDYKVYEYDPETGSQKIVISTNDIIKSSGVALNNKVYFGSYDGKVYEYDPETGSQKIVITAGSAIESSGVVLNNKVYFGSYDKKVYEYDPGTEENKVVITTNGAISSSGVILNNKMYIGSDDFKVYEYDPKIEEYKVVITTNGQINSSGAILNDNVYFGSNDQKVYEYDPETGSQKIVIRADNLIDSSGAVLNNKLYFGSYDRNLYEYDPRTGSQKVVLTTGGRIISSGVVLNNKLYFGSGADKSVYEYEILELIEQDIINMKEQIKRGLYLYYNKKENHSSSPKPISDVNLDNLIVISDLIINDKQKNESSNLEKVIDNVCTEFNSSLENENDKEQMMNTISCSEQTTKTETFEKMNGFSKSESTSNGENWSTSLNTEITATASSQGGVPLVFGAKLEVDVKVGKEYEWAGSQNYTIENTSNSSDTEIKTTTKTITVNIAQQSVKVPPHSKIPVFVVVWKNNIELILSYYQKVEGVVSADFIDENGNKNNFSTTIKNVMFSLSENNILPSKIKINNDDSVKLFYDIKTKKEIIMDKVVIGKTIPLSLN